LHVSGCAASLKNARSHAAAPNSEPFPLSAVVAVARRVRRVNSVVVPAKPAVPAV